MYMYAEHYNTDYQQHYKHFVWNFGMVTNKSCSANVSAEQFVL